MLVISVLTCIMILVISNYSYSNSYSKLQSNIVDTDISTNNIKIIVIGKSNLGYNNQVVTENNTLYLDTIPLPNYIDDNAVIIIGKIPLDKNSISRIRDLLLSNHILVFIDNNVYVNSMRALGNIIPGYYYVNVTSTYFVSLMKVNTQVYKGNGIIIYGIGGKPDYRKIYKVVQNINSIKTLQSEYDYSWIWVLNWSSDTGFYPYGKINVEHKLGKVINEEIPNEDWYFVRATTQVIPGIALGESNYRTDWIENKYDLKYENSYMYHLTDYDPTSMYNIGTTISVTLSGVCITGSIGWSYSGSYILSIVDKSDFGTDTAWWVHDLYQPGPIQWIAAAQTVKIEPGFLFRVNPLSDGTQLWIVKTKWIEPDSMGLPGDYVVRAVAFTVVFNLYP